jgi:hypothetical protein
MTIYHTTNCCKPSVSSLKSASSFLFVSSLYKHHHEELTWEVTIPFDCVRSKSVTRSFLFQAQVCLPLKRYTIVLKTVFWDATPCSLAEIRRRFRVISPDYGGSHHLWDFDKFPWDYTIQHRKRQPSSYSVPWKPEISTEAFLFHMRWTVRHKCPYSPYPVQQFHITFRMFSVVSCVL